MNASYSEYHLKYELQSLQMKESYLDSFVVYRKSIESGTEWLMIFNIV